jgi:hypothetical protein
MEAIMKKIGLGALIIAAVGVAAILIIAATGPDTFRIRRSITINAKPEKIAAHIVDFRKWTSWSPYEKYDPAMKRTHSGSKIGPGAVYEWKGNSDIGSGRMEIIDVSSSRVSIKLDFFEPFEGHNTAEFIFEPAGASTRVTWEMHGPNRFIGKVMHIFINMDKMVGKDFEAGLQHLKSISEK